MTTKPHWNIPAWLITIILAYISILAALTVLNRLGADRWWYGALNLYLPQAVWAAPGMLLVALVFKVAR